MGRVLEVLAHLVVVIRLEVAALGLLEAPDRTLAVQHVMKAPVRGARTQDAVAPSGMEEAHGIGIQLLAEGIDGLVHHTHAEVGGSGLASGIGHRHGDLHGLARLVAFLVCGHGHLQPSVPLGHPDGHFDELAPPLGHDLEDRPGIGLHGGGDGDFHQGRGARDGAALALTQGLTFEGPVQGELGAGQLHEDAGRVTGLVFGLVRRSPQIRHRRQRRALGGHGHLPLGHHRAALGILGLGHQQVGAAFGNAEAGRRAHSRSHGLAGLQGAGTRPPVGVVLFHQNAGRPEGDGDTRHLLAVEIQSPGRHLEGLARQGHGTVRGDHQHQIASGGADLSLAAVALTGTVHHLHHHAPEAIALGLEAGELRLALIVQDQLAALHELWGGARVIVVPDPAALGRHHLVEEPVGLGPAHRGAVEVAGVGVEVQGVAQAHLGLLRADLHLEGRLHELLDLELRLPRALGPLEHDAVEAQAPSARQVELGGIGASLGVEQLGLSLGHFGVLGVQHRVGQAGSAAGDMVLAVLHPPEDGLGEHLLTGPVEGSLREGIEPLPHGCGALAFAGQQGQAGPTAGQYHPAQAGAGIEFGPALGIEGRSAELGAFEDLGVHARLGRTVAAIHSLEPQLRAVLLRKQGQVGDHPGHVGRIAALQHLHQVEARGLGRQLHAAEEALLAIAFVFILAVAGLPLGNVLAHLGHDFCEEREARLALQGQSISFPHGSAPCLGRGQALRLFRGIAQGPGGRAVHGDEGPPPTPEHRLAQEIQGILGAASALSHGLVPLQEHLLQELIRVLHAVNPDAGAHRDGSRSLQLAGLARQGGSEGGEGAGPALFAPGGFGALLLRGAQGGQQQRDR